MHFKTKDLLITVLPKAGIANEDLVKACLWQTRICTAPTACGRSCWVGGTEMPGLPCVRFTQNFCDATVFCPRNTVGTGYANCGGTVNCAGASHDPWVINDREDLAVLRDELEETLKQLKELEKEVPSAIRSKADADELERELKQVIQQVRKPRKP